MELAFRLLVASFVIVAPSLLFLGLLRGLERLRDDRLADRALDRPNGAVPRTASDPTARFSDANARSSETETTACTACGRENPPFASFCADCLGSLDAPRRR